MSKIKTSKGKKLEIKTPKLKEIPYQLLLDSEDTISELVVTYNSISNISLPSDFKYNEDIQKILKKITKLTIMCCLLNSTEGIQNFVHLQEVNLQSNNIHDLSGFNTLKEVKTINLDSNQLLSLHDALINCRRLEYLHVSHNRLEDFGSGFNAATSTLKEIHAADNKIQSLKGFGRGLQALDELDISRNPIQTASGLATSIRKTLRVLHMDQCQIKSFKDWKPFPKVTHLYISNNGISSLEDFSTLFPSLEVLNIKNNRIPSVTNLEPLQKISDTLLILKIAGNPLCSQADYAEQIQKQFPNLVLDDQEYQPPASILKGEEKKLFEDSGLDFRMDLESLKKQLDVKLEIERKEAPQTEVVDPATEKFLKLLESKDEKKKNIEKEHKKNKEALISKDDARLMYEDCQKAQEIVEQKFDELYTFMDTPYEDIILDGKKIITRTTTIVPEDIRNISRPETASSRTYRPSSVASSLTSTSFEEYFKPDGALDLDLPIDNESVLSQLSSREDTPKKASKLKRKILDAQAFSNQLTKELGDSDSDFNHQRLYKSTGLDRKAVKNSEEILKSLNIPTTKQQSMKVKPKPITTGTRRFRVPKRLLDTVNTVKVEIDRHLESTNSEQ